MGLGLSNAMAPKNLPMSVYTDTVVYPFCQIEATYSTKI